MSVFSKILKDYLKYLRIIFEILEEKRVIISAKKCFLGYLSTTLLGKRVNRFRLASDEYKV